MVQLAQLMPVRKAWRRVGSPVATMRDYLEGMAAPPRLPSPDVSYPRIVAANGPKMLALSAEMADGAMPAMPDPEFTARARELLGPDKLLVVLAGSALGQDAPEVADELGRHLDAGADHVITSLPMGTDFAAGVDHLVRIAPSVLHTG